MKNFLLLALLAVGFFYTECHKTPDPPPAPEEQLPPATQEGKMTFGCLIDGKPWTPKAGIIPPPISVSYNELTGQFNLLTRKNLDNTLFQFIALNSVFKDEIDVSLEAKKCFYSDTSTVCPSPSSIDPVSMIGSKEFWNATGTMNISRLDISLGIISGTFEFDGYSPECQDTVRITKGRFDIKYK